MKEEILYQLPSPSRDTLVIHGFRFGKGEPLLAITGAMRGDALSQLHVASQLVKHLKAEEAKGNLLGEVLVIPALNPFALNMGGRFWPLDKTDIDAMFPGYDRGETTQRIAHALFEHLKGFRYGIVLEGRKDRSVCMPYVKLLKSGTENAKIARRFGLRFIHRRDPSPLESGSLLYNWQVFETDTFSLVFGQNGALDNPACEIVSESILRFMSQMEIGQWPSMHLYHSNILENEKVQVVKAQLSGIFLPHIVPGKMVSEGERLATITDALSGETIEEIDSPTHGIVTCAYDYPLIFGQAIAFRIARYKK